LNTPAYHIVTDAAHTNLNTGDFEMPHKVHLTRPGTDAVADSAHGNSKLGTASLIGNVVVHDSGNAPEAGAQNGYSGSGPATLLCDQLEIDSKAKLYTATGHVHFSQGTRSGTADKAILNRASGMLHLEGSVRLSDNGSTLAGDSVDYNLNTKDAEVHGSPAVMSQPANQPAQPAKSQPPKPPPNANSSPPKTKPKPAPTRKP
jgi:lipopolysaccharide export system protein LptA